MSVKQQYEMNLLIIPKNMNTCAG